MPLQSLSLPPADVPNKGVPPPKADDELHQDLRDIKREITDLAGRLANTPTPEPPWYVKAALPAAIIVALGAVAGYFRLESTVSHMRAEIVRVETTIGGLQHHASAAGHPVLKAAVERLESRVTQNEKMRVDVEAIRVGLCQRWKIACRRSE